MHFSHSYGVSDGQKFLGMEVEDTINPPCEGIEGVSGNRLTSVREGVASSHTRAKYPGKVEITLKPNEQWGSCFTPTHTGVTAQYEYKYRLSSDKGLRLEVYRNWAHERYGIKYIEVTIYRDITNFTSE